MRRSLRLDRYLPLVGEEVLSQVYRAAETLVGLRVLHINTTARGGGVAELLQPLLPLMAELGIPHTWTILPLPGPAQHFTAQLALALQGMRSGTLAEEDQQWFLETLRGAPVMQQIHKHHADLYYIHDFQLAPLANCFPWMRPALWMSHLDTAAPSAQGRRTLLHFWVGIPSVGLPPHARSSVASRQHRLLSSRQPSIRSAPKTAVLPSVRGEESCCSAASIPTDRSSRKFRA